MILEQHHELTGLFDDVIGPSKVIMTLVDFGGRSRLDWICSWSGLLVPKEADKSTEDAFPLRGLVGRHQNGITCILERGMS